MRNFRNKVAVLTGAGSGIGRGLALELAERGAKLALSDVDPVTVAETAARCEKLGATAIPFELDVADRAAVYAHADDVRAEFGRVDLVVNNAGIALNADVVEMTWADFDRVMNVDFWGVAHGTKAFLPDLIDSGDGHLVNISSVFGLMGIPSQSAYNAAKFAVRGFTEALRQEMLIGKYPVGVTCVHPGGVKTNIAVNARGLPDTVDIETVRKGFDLIALTSPRSAARTILKGVEKNKARVLIGPDARGFDLIPRVLGPRYEDAGAPLYRVGRRVAGRFGVEL
ncbi:SDR family NAD(P)-dependent oxidoreductase [Nocardia puris]|uniref:NADP-dependent 3-hydroxy acid dehydrogenase YdfG n=1 Tax=Nocardia puris TaxID=208602 RepID=A0A366DXF4_9NOCA|nr:SDR family oxidoreductase [Nocardia puris]RBO94209.1 NADP-dependent 3-hydroxy acid dehydrogenase YdfG [Nocardia puris]